MPQRKKTRMSTRKTRRRTLRNRSRRGGGKTKEKMRVSNTVLRSRSIPRYIEKKADIEEVAPGYPKEAYDTVWKKVKSGAIYATAAAVAVWLYEVYGSVPGLS